MLKDAGIKFDQLKASGINHSSFAYNFTIGDIAFNQDIKWVAFHGGWDFAYFLALLYGKNLPETVEEFYEHMGYFFPQIYDLKYLIQQAPVQNSRMGLSKLSDSLQITRIGPQHQAGSDSLLTLQCFFKIKDKYFADDIDRMKKSANIIYGIGKGQTGEFYYLSQSIKPAAEEQDYNAYANYNHSQYMSQPYYMD